MFIKIAGAAMNLMHSSGFGKDEARQGNHTTAKVVEGGHTPMQSKREASLSMREMPRISQEHVLEKQSLSRVDIGAAAVERASYGCSTALDNEKIAHGHNHSNVKINILNKDMLGHYKHGRDASQCTTQVEHLPDSPLKECDASLADENYIMKRKYADLQKGYRDLKAKGHVIDDEKRRLKFGNRELEKRNEDLNNFYSTIVDHLFKPYIDATGTESGLSSLLNDILRDALEGRSAKRLHQNQLGSLQAEKRSLQDQIDSLQQELLSSVDRQSIVSDDEFAQGFRWLAAAIKTLSRKLCLPSGIQLAGVSELASAILLEGIGNSQWSGRGRKKAVVEAFIWSTLITAVFRSPFQVLGKQADKVANIWSEIFKRTHFDEWPTPRDLAERWRCMNVEHRVQQSGKEAVTTGSSGALWEGIYKHVLETLGKISPHTDFSQLSVIIDKAFSLALDMSLQRCRLRVVSPSIGDVYSRNQTLHLTSINEDEELHKGTVAFIVQPGLIKWGDSHGKNLNQNLVLVPSKVYVLPLVD